MKLEWLKLSAQAGKPLQRAAFALLICASVQAASVSITFEAFPGPDAILGTGDDVPLPSPCPFGPGGWFCQSLSTEYSTVGVTFTTAQLAYGAGDHYLTDSSYSAGFFSVPVGGVSIDSDSWWTITLLVYDQFDNLMGIDQLLHPSPGGFAFHGTLSIASATPIARFVAQTDSAFHMANLDNLTFTTSAAVPEPSSCAFVALGLISWALCDSRRWCRKRPIKGRFLTSLDTTGQVALAEPRS